MAHFLSCLHSEEETSCSLADARVALDIALAAKPSIAGKATLADAL
jgi:hypothetical protein